MNYPGDFATAVKAKQGSVKGWTFFTPFEKCYSPVSVSHYCGLIYTLVNFVTFSNVMDFSH